MAASKRIHQMTVIDFERMFPDEDAWPPISSNIAGRMAFTARAAVLSGSMI